MSFLNLLGRKMEHFRYELDVRLAEDLSGTQLRIWTTTSEIGLYVRFAR